jgi:TPR repeat protein
MVLLLSTAAGAQNAKQLYEEGKALYDAKNYTQAFPKLKAAAEKGNKKAQYRLGRCYDKGRGVKEDNTTAYQWYLKSANQDYAKAQYQLGRCYLKGKGTTADAAKAKTWLKKAVKNPKKGDEVLQELKDDAAKGDEEAKRILTIIGK